MAADRRTGNWNVGTHSSGVRALYELIHHCCGICVPSPGPSGSPGRFQCFGGLACKLVLAAGGTNEEEVIEGGAA